MRACAFILGALACKNRQWQNEHHRHASSVAILAQGGIDSLKKLLDAHGWRYTTKKKGWEGEGEQCLYGCWFLLVLQGVLGAGGSLQED